MSAKVRGDSFWDAQPAEQLEALETWLFEENLTYPDALARWEKEFGKPGSVASLSRWYSRRREERMLERIAENARISNSAVTKFSQENPQLDSAFTNLLKQVAFDLVSQEKPNPEALCMVASQALKLRDQELKSEQLKLGRDKFQFDAAKAALQHLPFLRQIAAHKGMDQTAKIDAIRERLFGKDIVEATK